MTTIRSATESDIPALVAMGRDMLGESSFRVMIYSRERTADMIRRCIEGGFAAVSVEGDDLTGVILGEVVQPWYSDECMGIEHVLYVRPASRGTRAALMLVKAWARWCFDCGAKQIRPGTAAGSEPANRLYQALGFKPAGVLYVMDRGA